MDNKTNKKTSIKNKTKNKKETEINKTNKIQQNNSNLNTSKHNNAENNNQNTEKDLIGLEKTQNNTELNVNSTSKISKKHNFLTAFIIIGITLLVAILGSLLGGKKVDGRTNPPLYPPEWLFPIMWGILYIIIAIASLIVYRISDKEKRKENMIWYGIHLFFNLFWPMFYFRLDQLIVSTIWLLFMVITAIILTYKYFKSNLISGTIFTFYTLWLLYAMYLNLSITLLNI